MADETRHGESLLDWIVELRMDTGVDSKVDTIGRIKCGGSDCIGLIGRL